MWVFIIIFYLQCHFSGNSWHLRALRPGSSDKQMSRTGVIDEIVPA